MKRCPKCGTKDAALIRAQKTYAATPEARRLRAAYMREYRKAQRLGLDVTTLRARLSKIGPPGDARRAFVMESLSPK